LIEPKRVKHI